MKSRPRPEFFRCVCSAAAMLFFISIPVYASHPGVSIEAIQIGNVSSTDASFTDLRVSSITNGECIQSSSGKLVGSGGACGAGGAGDVSSVGNCLSGACAAASTTDATFGPIQTKIGSVTAGDGTFATIRATKIDATKIGTMSTADATFSSIRVDTDVLMVNPVTNRVGIGLTAPTAALEITGPNTTNDPILLVTSAGAQSNVASLASNAGGTSLFYTANAGHFITAAGANDGGILVGAGMAVHFGTSGNSSMVLDGSGNWYVTSLVSGGGFEYVCCDTAGLIFLSSIPCDTI